MGVPIFGIPMPLSMSGGCGNVMSTTTLLDLSPGERDAIANYLQNENQVDQISFCIGNKHVYVFLRLYNHLLERFYLAYNLCKLTPTNPEYVAVSEMLLCRCCQPHSTAAKAATASFNSFLSAVTYVSRAGEEMTAVLRTTMTVYAERQGRMVR